MTSYVVRIGAEERLCGPNVAQAPEPISLQICCFCEALVERSHKRNPVIGSRCLGGRMRANPREPTRAHNAWARAEGRRLLGLSA